LRNEFIVSSIDFPHTNFIKQKFLRAGIRRFGNELNSIIETMQIHYCSYTMTRNKTILSFLFLLCFEIAFCQNAKFINPSGYYSLDSKTYKKNGEIYGYSGTLKVLLLNKEKILVSFYTNKGAPSYNSGELRDSLDYKHNISVYTGDGDDTTCKITLFFEEKGVFIEMMSANPNFACGFGHAVDAQGYYKKTSHKIPTKEELFEESDN